MEQLRCAGATVSEYVGDGQGENADIEERSVEQVYVVDEVQEEAQDEAQEEPQDEVQEYSDEDPTVPEDGFPLLFYL